MRFCSRARKKKRGLVNEEIGDRGQESNSRHQDDRISDTYSQVGKVLWDKA